MSDWLDYYMFMRSDRIFECDGGSIGGPMSNATNVNGIGNPVPPSESTGWIGSGDKWGDCGNMCTQGSQSKRSPGKRRILRHSGKK